MIPTLRNPEDEKEQWVYDLPTTADAEVSKIFSTNPDEEDVDLLGNEGAYTAKLHEVFERKEGRDLTADEVDAMRFASYGETPAAEIWRYEQNLRLDDKRFKPSGYQDNSMKQVQRAQGFDALPKDRREELGQLKEELSDVMETLGFIDPPEDPVKLGAYMLDPRSSQFENMPELDKRGLRQGAELNRDRIMEKVSTLPENERRALQVELSADELGSIFLQSVSARMKGIETKGRDIATAFTGGFAGDVSGKLMSDEFSKAEQYIAQQRDSIEDYFKIQELSGFEKDALAGNIKGGAGRMKASMWRVGTNQKLAAMATVGAWGSIDRDLETYSKIESALEASMPVAESVGGRTVQALGDSALPMISSMALDYLSAGTAGKAYWYADGMGSVIKDYALNNGVKLSEMSDDDKAKLTTIASMTGAVYAAIEYVGGAMGAQGLGLTGRLSNVINKAMTDNAVFDNIVRGGIRYTIDSLGEAFEEGGQDAAIKTGVEAMEGRFDPLGSVSLMAETTVASIPFSFALTGIIGSPHLVSNIQTGMKDQDLLDTIKQRITSDTTKARAIFDKVKSKTTAADRAEVLNQSVKDNVEEVVQKRVIRSIEKRQGFRTGADGTPLNKAAWDEVLNPVNGAPRTKADILDSLPDDFAYTDLFIRAAEGDKKAQTEYNREVVRNGLAPQPLFQSTPSIKDDTFTVGEDEDIDPTVREEYGAMTDAQLAETASTYLEMGATLSPALKSVIAERFATEEDVGVFGRQVQRMISERKGEEVKDAIRINVLNVGKQITDVEDRYLQSGSSALQTGFKLLSRHLRNLPDEHWKLAGAKKYSEKSGETEDSARNYLRFKNAQEQEKKFAKVFYKAVQTGDMNRVTELLNEFGLKPDQTFGTWMQVATRHYALAKQVREAGQNWTQSTVVAPKVAEIRDAFNISDDHAQTLYALYVASGVPMDRIKFVRDADGSTKAIDTRRLTEQEELILKRDAGVATPEEVNRLEEFDNFDEQFETLENRSIVRFADGAYRVVGSKLMKADDPVTSTFEATAQTVDRLTNENYETDPDFIEALDVLDKEFLKATEAWEQNPTPESLRAVREAQEKIATLAGEEAPADVASLTAPAGMTAEEWTRRKDRAEELFQVGSENFKRWFGDSKVVDADGKPLVVYHGSRAKFDVFDIDKIGQQGRMEGSGFYFTDDQNVASGYNTRGQGQVVDAYLSLKNPMDYNRNGFTKDELRKLLWRMAELEHEYDPEISMDDTFIANFDGLEGAVDLVSQDEKAIDQMGGLLGAGVLTEHLNQALNEVMGIDGIKSEGFGGEGKGGGTIYVAFFPEQIKSATGNVGTFDPNNPNILFQSQDSLGFYSQVAATIQSFNQDTFTPQQLGAMVKKATGVKQEELDDLGFLDWLDGMEGKVTKQQALEFIQKGGVQIQEVERAPNYISSHTSKFDEYQLPGGENYREILLTLPERSGYVVRETPQGKFMVFDQNNLPVTSPIDTREQAEFAMRTTTAVANKNYSSSHWDEANVLAHFRLNDRTGANGERILFIEEIQSDWHQEGRKKGYKYDGPKMVHTDGTKFSSINEANAYAEEHGGDLTYVANATGVPNAPFKKSWAMLSMKRILKMAAEQGYDSVAWTPGEVQNERYKLSDKIDSIDVNTKDGTRKVRIQPTQNNSIIFSVNEDGTVSSRNHGGTEFDGKMLDEVVGKEMAEKIMAVDGSTSFSGDGLDVGGSGMVGFYDKILPKEVGKYVKKMGGKVGTTEISGLTDGSKVSQLPLGISEKFSGGFEVYDNSGTVLQAFATTEQADKFIKEKTEELSKTIEDNDSTEVWNLPLTDQMRQKFTEEGQPLYQDEYKGSFEYVPDGQSITKGFETSDVSTGVHELGHAARRFLFSSQGQEKDNPNRMSDEDISTAERVYGVEAGRWSVEQEEKFADDFTNWVREGKAPAPELDNVFKKLGRWLAEIFVSAPSTVSPEMADIFTRMMARNKDSMGELIEQAGERAVSQTVGYANQAASAEAEALIELFNVNELNLTEAEAETVMKYLAGRQGIFADDEGDGVGMPLREELPEQIDMLLDGWDGNFKQLAGRIQEISKRLGMEFRPISEGYFPLRHDVPQELDDVGDDELAMISGRNVTASRTAGFRGVILDPKQQLQAYLTDVATFLSLGESVANMREIASTSIEDIALAWEKQEAGAELTTAEKTALRIKSELEELERAGQSLRGGLKINASQMVTPGFMKAVAKSTRTSRSNLEGIIPNAFLTMTDPGMAAIWMDGVSEEYMKQTGEFAGGNYQMRRNLLVSAAEQKAKVQGAIDRIYNVRKENLTGPEANKEFQKKMSEIWSDADNRKGLYRATARKNLNAVMSYGLTAEEAKVAMTIVQEFSNLAKEKAAGEMSTKSEYARTIEKVRAEWIELSNKKELTKEETTRLAYLEKKHGDSLFNTVARFVFEKQALRNTDFYGFTESVLSRGYNDAIMGRQSMQMTEWAEFLRTKGLDAYATWWDNLNKTNLKGELSTIEREIMTGFAKSAVGIKSAVLGMFGKESGMTIDDVKLGAQTVANELHRARINAWLAGNWAWSLTTQLASLAMTVKNAGFMNVGKGIKGAFSKNLKVPESVVREIKGSGKGLAGKAFEVNEWQQKKLRASWRTTFGNWLGRFASSVENKTVVISYIAGQEKAKQLGLEGSEAEMFADYMAENTQSMYDQHTRNMMLSSPGLRAIAPMQAFVLTQFSNTLDLMNKAGYDKSAKSRVKEAIEWKVAAVIWDYVWSVIYGDDPEKAWFDPTFEKENLSSYMPFIGSVVPVDEFSTSIKNKFLPKRYEESSEFWKKNPAEQFLQNTERMLDFSNEKQGRDTFRWVAKYVQPHSGIPGGILTDRFIMAYNAMLDDGEVRGKNGRAYATVDWLGDDANPGKKFAAMFTASLFGTRMTDGFMEGLDDKEEESGGKSKKTKFIRRR